MSVINDENVNSTLTTAKVYITSLNSHSTEIYFGTRYGEHKKA
jgi:hypothetical protein